MENKLDNKKIFTLLYFKYNSNPINLNAFIEDVLNDSYEKYINEKYDSKELADEIFISLSRNSQKQKNKFIIQDIRLFYKALKKFDINMYHYLLKESDKDFKRIIIFSTDTKELKKAFREYKNYIDSKYLRNELNKLKLVRTKDNIITHEKQRQEEVTKNTNLIEDIKSEITKKYIKEGGLNGER